MAKSKKKKDAASHTPRITNRRARHDYHVLDSMEVGIMLRGSEVKAIREGKVQLTEGFARVDPNRMELYLYNVDISPYSHASGANSHERLSIRKLLARKRQIRKLLLESEDRGITLIPLTLYFVRGLVKIELGICKGKHQQDKRQDLRKKETDRDIQRAMTRKHL